MYSLIFILLASISVEGATRRDFVKNICRQADQENDGMSEQSHYSDLSDLDIATKVPISEWDPSAWHAYDDQNRLIQECSQKNQPYGTQHALRSSDYFGAQVHSDHQGCLQRLIESAQGTHREEEQGKSWESATTLSLSDARQSIYNKVSEIHAPRNKWKKTDVTDNTWKARLHSKIGLIQKTYGKYVHCGLDKARAHLDYVADENLAWALLDPNEAISSLAAHAIFEKAKDHFSESNSRRSLGRNQSAIFNLLYEELGKSKPTVWRFLNRVITEEIAELFQDDRTWGLGIEKLVQMFNKEQESRFGICSTSNEVEEENPGPSGYPEAPLQVENEDDECMTFPFFVVPENGSGREMLGPNMYWVCKQFRRAIGCSHQEFARFVKKAVNYDIAISINTPSAQEAATNDACKSHGPMSLDLHLWSHSSQPDASADVDVSHNVQSLDSGVQNLAGIDIIPISSDDEEEDKEEVQITNRDDWTEAYQEWYRHKRFIKASKAYARITKYHYNTSKRHLETANNGELTEQLLCKNKEKRYDAAMKILNGIKQSQRFESDSRAVQLLGGRLPQVKKDFHKLTGDSDTTVWRNLNTLMNERIARKLSNRKTYEQGMKVLLHAYSLLPKVIARRKREEEIKAYSETNM